MHELYTNIKSKRLANNWTQTELAAKVGYSDKSMIAKIESGKIDLSQNKIVEFANVFGCTPGELMGWTSAESNIEHMMNRIKTFYRTREFNFKGINCDEFVHETIIKIMELYDVNSTEVPDLEIRRICNMTFTRLNREKNNYMYHPDSSMINEENFEILEHHAVVPDPFGGLTELQVEELKKAGDLYKRYKEAPESIKAAIKNLLGLE